MMRKCFTYLLVCYPEYIKYQWVLLFTSSCVPWTFVRLQISIARRPASLSATCYCDTGINSHVTWRVSRLLHLIHIPYWVSELRFNQVWRTLFCVPDVQIFSLNIFLTFWYEINYDSKLRWNIKFEFSAL